LPLGSNAIGCKWILKTKIKYNSDGWIQTFRERLVAKSFRQKEGINYFDTYALMACITSIKVLSTLSSIYNLYVHQMDVKTTPFNGELDEKVYMEQLEGFVLPEMNIKFVNWLNIYMDWNRHLSNDMKNLIL